MTEIESLRVDLEDADALREKLAGILTRTINALKGPPPENVVWSWHDLPEIAERMRSFVDVVLAFEAAMDLREVIWKTANDMDPRNLVADEEVRILRERRTNLIAEERLARLEVARQHESYGRQP